MEDPESEQFVQIFLFAATIFCYIILFIFLSFALYSCCMKNCVNKCRKRKEGLQRESQLFDEQEQNELAKRNLAYGANVNIKLIVENDKKATIIPMGTGNNPATSANNNLNSNVEIWQTSSSNDHFVDKKYYDIFHV